MISNPCLQLRPLLICLALGASALLSTPAAGGLLLGDGNAVASATIPLIAATDNVHFGDLEWAVYEANDFALSFPGADTPNGGVANGEWVYAFQVFDNGAKTTGITRFSAGMGDVGPGNPLPTTQGYGDGIDDDEQVNPGDAHYVAGTGSDPLKAPTLVLGLAAQVTSTSVVFNFAGPNSLKNEWSPVLFYTSPWAPGFDNGTTTPALQNVGFGGAVRIPSPEEGRIQPFIPEPSSFILTMIAVAGLGLRRGRK